MRVSTVVTLALTVLLATSAVGAVVAVPSGSAPARDRDSTVADPPSLEGSSLSLPSSQQPTESPLQPTQRSLSTQQSPPPAADPEQVIRINVTASGDAEWTIESRFRLTDDGTDDQWDADTFVQWADSVAAGERSVGYDRQTFEPRVRAAAESTDREMTLENASWDEPRIETFNETDDDRDDAQVGVISYSFVWTDFATVDDNRIYFGDAFRTDTGYWLTTLADGQQLVVQSPPNYGFDDYNLPVSPEGGALILDGPYQFAEDDLDVVFLRGANGNGVEGILLPGSSQLLGGIALLLLVGAGGYLLARRRSDRERLPDLPVGLPGRWSDGADGPRDAPGAEDGAGAAASSATEGAAAANSGERLEYEEEIDDDVDPELLSDEERVLRLLRKNGGRMKQASIVKETGWSNAKVSQLLSKMDDGEEIEKLRIGRENLITLPEVDPTELD